jgi:hypothetical protein
MAWSVDKGSFHNSIIKTVLRVLHEQRNYQVIGRQRELHDEELG